MDTNGGRNGPPSCSYCIWWKSSTRKGWALKYISLVKWSTVHLELTHPLTKQSWYSFIMPAGILNYIITFLATWGEELTHWKRPWCWERLRASREGDDGGWDGWTASPTQWMWVWASFRSWWWTGRPGVLQSMGLQRVGHDWVTELNWLHFKKFLIGNNCFTMLCRFLPYDHVYQLWAHIYILPPCPQVTPL